jgi:hypothetical protein
MRTVRERTEKDTVNTLSAIDRRTALKAAGAAMAGVAGGTLLLSSPAAAAPVRDGRPQSITSDNVRTLPVDEGPRTANGWPAVAAADAGGMVLSRPVEGTDIVTGIHIGNVEAVLFHVVRRFHYEIAELDAGDVHGFAPLARTQADYETNHASGTAVAILPGHYPRGTRDGFFPAQRAVVEDILAECEGVVAWAGQRRPVNESVFYIAVPPDDQRLEAVYRKIRGWSGHPGRGAGIRGAGVL